MKPEPVDREAMDLLFGDKAKFLEKVIGWVKETLVAGDEDKLVEALEELESQVTDIDNAGDLDHVGGVDIVMSLLEHPTPKVTLQIQPQILASLFPGPFFSPSRKKLLGIISAGIEQAQLCAHTHIGKKERIAE